MTLRKKLIIPLALTATAWLGCGQNPVTDAAMTDTATSDGQGSETGNTDASCTQCMAVTEQDSSVVRYMVCQSTTASCACVIYPDGAVEDPTFC